IAEIDASEDLIEKTQRIAWGFGNFCARSYSLKVLNQAVVEEIGLVEIQTRVGLSGKRTDVAQVNRDIATDAACHGQRYVLNVGTGEVLIENREVCRARSRRRYGLQRLRRLRKRNSGVQVRK